MSYPEIGIKMGQDHKDYVRNLLYRNDGMTMSVSKLLSLLDAVGYQIIVSDMDSDVEYILDGEDEGLNYRRYGYDE